MPGRVTDAVDIVQSGSDLVASLAPLDPVDEPLEDARAAERHPFLPIRHRAWCIRIGPEIPSRREHDWRWKASLVELVDRAHVSGVAGVTPPWGRRGVDDAASLLSASCRRWPGNCAGAGGVRDQTRPVFTSVTWSARRPPRQACEVKAPPLRPPASPASVSDSGTLDACLDDTVSSSAATGGGTERWRRRVPSMRTKSAPPRQRAIPARTYAIAGLREPVRHVLPSAYCRRPPSVKRSATIPAYQPMFRPGSAAQMALSPSGVKSDRPSCRPRRVLPPLTVCVSIRLQQCWGSAPAGAARSQFARIWRRRPWHGCWPRT